MKIGVLLPVWKCKEKFAEGGSPEGNNTYHAFYNKKTLELKSDTAYHAQLKAAELFKAKKSYEVAVVLVAKGDEPVIHSTSEFEKGGFVKNPTNNDVIAKGEFVDSWASDIGGSNESQDIITEYQGKKYLTVCDWDGAPLYPNKKASLYEDEEFAKGGRVRIKEPDIQVGNRFGLPNGGVLEIKKRFVANKFNGDDVDVSDNEMFVVYTHSDEKDKDKEHESSRHSLILFLNNWKAELINKHNEETLGEKYWTKYADGGSTKTHQYKLGDKWRSDFDYRGMFKKALKADSSWDVEKLEKLSSSMRDVNYHDEARAIEFAIDEIKKGNKTYAQKKLDELHSLVKEAFDALYDEGIATIERDELNGKYKVFIDGSYYAEFDKPEDAIEYCEAGGFEIVKKYEKGGEVESSYTVEYYDRVGEHGEIGSFPVSFEIAMKEAVKLKNRLKKSNELGSETLYIGVQPVYGDGNKFGIVYLHPDYIKNRLSAQDFSDEKDYTAWMKVAEKVLKTGNSANGEYSKKYQRGGYVIGDYMRFSKIDYDVNIELKNLEVDVQIKKNDSVNQHALSDTGVKWNQEHWGYVIYPKTLSELLKVLRVLKVSFNEKRLENAFSGKQYAEGGDVEKYKGNLEFKKTLNNAKEKALREGYDVVLWEENDGSGFSFTREYTGMDKGIISGDIIVYLIPRNIGGIKTVEEHYKKYAEGGDVEKIKEATLSSIDKIDKVSTRMIARDAGLSEAQVESLVKDLEDSDKVEDFNEKIHILMMIKMGVLKEEFSQSFAKGGKIDWASLKAKAKGLGHTIVEKSSHAYEGSKKVVKKSLEKQEKKITLNFLGDFIKNLEKEHESKKNIDAVKATSKLVKKGV